MEMNDPAQRARALIENLADVILVLDRDGVMVWASPAVRRHGLTPEGCVGRTAASQFHPGDANRFEKGFKEALAHPGEPITLESLRLGPAADRARIADDTLTFLPATAGIDGVLVVIHEVASHVTLMATELRDVPGERTSERGLRESEEQLRQVVRLSHIGTFDHHHLTGEIYWSPEQRKLYGWGPEEPLIAPRTPDTQWNTWNLIHPDDRDRVAAALRAAHAGEGDGLFDLEYRIIRRDGSVRWLTTRSQTFFEGSGPARRPVRTVGAVQDITAHKLAERQLQLTQTSVDKCNIAIFWTSPGGQIAYANDEACRSLGRTREDLVGLHVWDFDPDVAPGAWRTTWDQIRNEKSLSMQTRHRRKDGSLFPVEVVGSYLKFDGEEQVFVFAQDVTDRQRAERELRMLHAAIDKSHTPFYAISPSGEIVYANEQACRTLGLTRQALIGRHTWDIDPDFRPEDQSVYWKSAKDAGALHFETHHIRADGSRFPVAVTAEYFSYKDEEYTLAFAQDITERMQAELIRRQNEERLKQVVLVYDIGIFEHDHSTDTIHWSPELRRYWGLTPDDPGPLNTFIDAVHPGDLERTVQAVKRAHDPNGDGRYSERHRIIRKDGSIRWLDTRSQTFFEGSGSSRHPVRTIGAMVDVTERHQLEETLRHSLHEKETLLREVHHRVKNNLQIIASLLHFQAKKVKDPDDLAAFADGRNRLRSMILVHEKLYQSPDLSRIDFGSYLQALVRDLQRSYSATGKNIDVRVAADSLALPIESALPCGMILCELLTNVFKYAFPDGQPGKAEVSLTAADSRVRLNVSDNGVGLPEGFDPEHGTSFGWQLIRNLTRQLGGSVSVGRQGGGTHVTIAFEERPRAP